jgi:hypothetical protein
VTLLYKGAITQDTGEASISSYSSSFQHYLTVRCNPGLDRRTDHSGDGSTVIRSRDPRAQSLDALFLPTSYEI